GCCRVCGGSSRGHAWKRRRSTSCVASWLASRKGYKTAGGNEVAYARRSGRRDTRDCVVPAKAGPSSVCTKDAGFPLTRERQYRVARRREASLLGNRSRILE